MSASPSARDWALLLALVALWGSAFALIERAVADLAPAVIVFLRLGIAAVVLGALVLLRGERRWPDGRDWARFALIGLLGHTLPFLLITWGQQGIASGLAAILIATMPLATLALARLLLPEEPLTIPRLLGFGLGFIGVVVLIGPAAFGAPDGAVSLWHGLAVLAAALSYAANAVLARRLLRTPPLLTSAGVLAAAALLAMPPALLAPSWTAAASPGALAAVVALGLLCTALAALIYFALIAGPGPNFVALSNYLVPVWAVALGAATFGERLSGHAYLALLLILLGIGIAQDRLRLWPKPRRADRLSPPAPRRPERDPEWGPDWD